MEKITLCPVCKGRTEVIKTITVKHFVLNNLKEKVEEGTYHICLDEDCDMVYFNLEKDIELKKEKMKIPIWFKKDANPKYICYCNKVTEQQIIDAVVNNGAKDIKDIIRITGAMKNAKCEINNPLSKCCSPAIESTIEKALNIEK